jgi:hypothetical protein
LLLLVSTPQPATAEAKAAEVLATFASDSSARVLFIQSVQEAAAEGDDAAPPTRFEFYDEVFYSDTSGTSLAFIKRTPGAIDDEQPLADQMQLVVLGESAGSEAGRTRTVGTVSLMHTYMHHSFLPLLQSMINQTQSAGGDASSDKKDQKIGLPAVTKKLKELELSLIQVRGAAGGACVGNSRLSLHCTDLHRVCSRFQRLLSPSPPPLPPPVPGAVQNP